MKMETDEMSLEDKCEHLMNIVVESRKRFGKMCIDYEQKMSLVENKMLNLQIETISNYRFKSKSAIPNINIEDMMKEVDEFKDEITNSQKRVDSLKQNVKNTQNVVLQLKADSVGRKLRKPLTVQAMLTDAKSKLKT
ncbi:uncharacterized protein LOC125074656 [Vanessa atalanta]|uniref:uncharacterized protein LOC125074656 n=1 Tax=Vanessa atalanta TaxID=42275 RepID=UPI001FCD35CE|nr:uncharacterized protein LOC125074656 [Vanessa atalanta]